MPLSLCLVLIIFQLRQSDAAAIEVNIPGVALRRVVSDTSKVSNLTRQHNGDIFYSDDVQECDTDTCVGLSSGTANLYIESNIKELDLSLRLGDNECRCQCLPHINTYREDLGICVDDIRECSMASFSSGGSTLEKIPFIFLPLKGQIIYPSKEISYPGIKDAVCEVKGSQYLSKSGWNELRNPADAKIPFKLFRDEQSTFLQWLGDPDLRYRMHGRLILVHLICRDITAFEITGPDRDINDHEDDLAVSASNQHGIFYPCVAFRIVGTPSKYTQNVTEVSFASEIHSDDSFFNLSTKEYIMIAIASLCLGLVYIASVFLYLHIRKRRNRSDTNGKDEFTYQQNDQVTFGAGISRGVFGGQSRSSLLSRSSIGGAANQRGSNMGLHTADEVVGVIKSNPLLKHYPNLSGTDNAGFVSDTSNSNSEFDDDFSIAQEGVGNSKTSATVHLRQRGDPQHELKIKSHAPHDPMQSIAVGSGQEPECLPIENVSITEDMTHEEQLENMKSIINGNARRKLYFNPAYFEPHLLVSPPPAAIEFLTKIREVISIAKYKMATKRYQPSLIVIPEEKLADGASGVRIPPSRRESLVSSRNENAHKSACSGCSDCQNRGSDTGTCKTCGDKQKSIQKWLEGVSSSHESLVDDPVDDVYGSRKELISKTDEEKPPKPPKPPSLCSKKSESSVSNSDNETVKALSSKTNRTIRTPFNGTLDSSLSNIYGTNDGAYETPRPSCLKSSVKADDDFYKISPKDYAPARPSSLRGSVKRIPDPQELYTTGSVRSGSNYGIYKLYGGSEIYNNPQFGGSEIYNNPQFDAKPTHSNKPPLPPPPSKPPHTEEYYRTYKKVNQSEEHKTARPNKNIPVEVMNKMNQMPDMVYEAMASDYNRMNTLNSQKSFNAPSPQLPTPDYGDEDSNYGTYRRMHQRLQKSMHGEDHPHVPTPDYNTIGRRTPKKLFAPDSPIYSRKSPYNLIVDYETDSLERITTVEKVRKSATPPSQSSEGSHASPSLSSALPLEEELEIRNAIYDRVEGFRKDDKKQEPKIKYNTPFLGSMTIELDHSPDEFDLSTDSDQFEPDTLDRKSKKKGGLPGVHGKPTRYFETPGIDQNYADNHMCSLPDMSQIDAIKTIEQQEIYKVGRRNSIACKEHLGVEKTDLRRSFESLREMYESKTNKNIPYTNVSKIAEIKTAEGKILSLEMRHSKRQRQATLDRKMVPPDLIPADKSRHFVKAPRSNRETLWSNRIKSDLKYMKQVNSAEEDSVASDSTTFTGISDMHENDIVCEKDGMYHNKIADDNLSFLEDYMSLGEITNQHYLDHVNSKIYAQRKKEEKEDLDKIEVISTKTPSQSGSLSKDETGSNKNKKMGYKEFDQAINNLPTTTKIFRVEVASTGMQLAMNVSKNQGKKTKDIKNAWRRFIDMASSKLTGKHEGKSETDKAVLSECIDKEDDGIGSLLEENCIISKKTNSLEHPRTNVSVSRSNSSRMSSRDTDPGYMSADSNDLRNQNKKLYERFNFNKSQVKSINEEKPVVEEIYEKPKKIQAHDISAPIIQHTTNQKQCIYMLSPPPKRPPPAPPILKTSSSSTAQSHPKSLSKSEKNTRKIIAQLNEVIKVNVYSSDEAEHHERYSNEGCGSSESEEEFSVDDVCESGAESVETHSVFYRNVRNNQAKAP